MISAWELYLWTRLDFFDGFLWAVFSGSTVLMLIAFTIMGNVKWDSEDDKKIALYMRSRTKSLIICAVIVVLVNVIVPTKKDAALIWITPQLATIENAELLQGEAAEIYKMAKQALTESLDINETQETK